MLPKIRIVLTNQDLQNVHKECAIKLGNMELWQSLSEEEKNLVGPRLRLFSDMVVANIMKEFYCPEEEKPAEPELPKGRMHEQVRVQEYVGYMPKEKARADFAENFRKVFGRELKQEA